MKTMFLFLIAIIFLIYFSRPELHIKPFSLKFNNGWYTLGMLFILSGLGFIEHAAEKRGYIKANEDIQKMIEETVAENNLKENTDAKK